VKTVKVQIPPKDGAAYDILIENDSLISIGKTLKSLFDTRVKTFAIVTDKNVAELYQEKVVASIAQEGYKVLVISMLAGEKTKCVESFFAICNWLAENQITRSDALIALGGGVIGDLTGYTAASFLRGVPFVQVPTTLLAMVDSSVGGKTGIDIPAGKNLVGAFYQPAGVICDPGTLSTLPPEVFSCGMAEVIKHGMIRSTNLLEMLSGKPVNSQLAQELAEIIEKKEKIKRTVVERDELDTGERQLLNFGHTIGHAIEKLSGFEISHGNAVAIGMNIITRAAVKRNACPPECLSILQELTQKFNLSGTSPFAPHEIFMASLSDKKRMGNYITEVIPRAVGECVLHKMPVNELSDWIEEGIGALI
jgi:3-dehydroquinate synthase